MKDCKCGNKDCKCELINANCDIKGDRICDGEMYDELTEKDSIEYNDEKLPKLESKEFSGELLLG